MTTEHIENPEEFKNKIKGITPDKTFRVNIKTDLSARKSSRGESLNFVDAYEQINLIQFYHLTATNVYDDQHKIEFLFPGKAQNNGTIQVSDDTEEYVEQFRTGEHKVYYNEYSKRVILQYGQRKIVLVFYDARQANVFVELYRSGTTNNVNGAQKNAEHNDFRLRLRLSGH